MSIRRSTLATALALGMAWGAAGAASAATTVSVGVHIGGRTTVDIGFFQTNLRSYGRWVDRPQYGRVFVPRVSRTSWRPYSLGHWVETDYGTTWISDEPFGWATYHYGRWYFDRDLGWVWVPGTEWGPAWVDFEETDDYIGWAPLPPSVEFDYDSGLRYGGFRAGYDAPYNSYSFVEERRFLEPRLTTYFVAPTRNVDFVRRARRVSNYGYENQRVINRSLPVARLERAIGRRVTRFQISDVGGATPVRQPRFRGNRVEIYRPEVVVQNAAARPRFDGREREEHRQARERLATQPARVPAQQQQAQRRQLREQQQQQQQSQQRAAQQEQQQRNQQRAAQAQQRNQQREAQAQQQQQQNQRRAAQAQQRNQQREAQAQQQQQQNQQRAAQAQAQQQRRQAREQQQQQAKEGNRGRKRPPQAENGDGGGKEKKPRGHKPPGQ